MDTFYSLSLFKRDFGKSVYLMGSNVAFLHLYEGKGRSFIHNLSELCHSKTPPIWKGEYIVLTAARNYLDVYLNNNRRLPLELALTLVPEHNINRNRLLLVQNGEVIFYHEEY